MNPIITKVLDDINKKEFAEWEVEWVNPVLNCYKSPDGTYKITKFGEKYEAFFKSEEKRFNYVATKMIKKISKVYSLAKKD